MGRAPCCDKANVKRGPWSPEEDFALKNYVERYGTGGNWISLPQRAGLKRCGKSCRLRWLNYLRPDIKHGGFTDEEDNIICSLYKNIGSRWSVIAAQLPGRTDNDVKNYWNTKLKKKILAGKINQSGTNKNNNQFQSSSAIVSPSQSSTENHHMPIVINQNVGSSSRMALNSAQFHSTGLMESPQLSVNVNNNQNVSSLPLPLDSSCWFDHGMNVDDRFLMDFGLGASYDLLSGFVPYVSNYDEILSNIPDTKPQGMFQQSKDYQLSYT
ncbi:hypothetical protein ACHQM5_001957 [Ranunculus cassubicifolius]